MSEEAQADDSRAGDSREGEPQAVAALVVISGRVQGVFFRESTRQQALRLGVCGYAQNNPDGTVTVHAEGLPGAVDELLAWCQGGPPAAHVTGVQRTACRVTGARTFDVKR